VREVIRGSIGFDGLLMPDDLSMQALSGTLGERAAAAIAAGCDVVLHCNGRLVEIRRSPQPCRDWKVKPAAELERRCGGRRASAIDLAAACAEFVDMIVSDPEAHAAKMQVTS